MFSEFLYAWLLYFISVALFFVPFFINTAPTACILLTWFPEMKLAYTSGKYRSHSMGNMVFDKSDTAITSTTHSSIINDDSVNKDKTIENLRRRITQLESALSQNQAPEN